MMIMNILRSDESLVEKYLQIVFFSHSERQIAFSELKF